MAVEESKTLANFVTPRLLRQVAGERYFHRGEAYFGAGAVRSLRREGGSVKAVVQGTRRYRVHLSVEDGELSHSCSCPIGRDGAFCKHCVAVGLAWYASGQGDDAGVTDDADICSEEVDLRAYLLGLEQEELVSLLVDQADEDERLHRRLTLRAAQARPGTADLSAWRGALADALQTDGFVDYGYAYDFAAGVEEVIESLEDLLQAGQADRVIQLAEHGLAEVEQSLEHVDDSDGWMGGILDRLQELHLEACRLARPNPVDLAERLFEGEMESPFDTFHRAILTYADILGEAGLTTYRRLAEAEWAKVLALKPGEEDPNRYGARFRITSIMEAMAEISGDLDTLITVKSRDLSSPYAFLQIAKLYHDAGDLDLALDWAERGWRAFSGTRQDERLRTFIAEAYHDRGRHDEAMSLIWEDFDAYPQIDTFRQLERHGRRAGQWPMWREKALTMTRERIADKTAEPPRTQNWMRSPPRDHSLLVEISLYEGDPETAWQEAQTGGCSNSLWLALAKRREKSHPADAARIYKGHVDSLLRDTGQRVYDEAVATLETIGALPARAGEEGAFRSLLTELRATHKRKRNLMKMLDRKGW